MTFAICVVAHPARAARAERLAETVGAEAISWDDAGIGHAENHLRALEWLEGSAADWGVILEDDAMPVPGFRLQLSAALYHAPAAAQVCSLYLGTGRPPHWQASIAQREGAVSVGACADVPWFSAPELLHGVGYAVRAGALRLLRRAARRRVVRQGEPIDEAVSAWLRQVFADCFYTRPSLVDHEDGPTLIAVHPTRHAATDPDMTSRAEPRRAWRVGSREAWSDDSLPLPLPLPARQTKRRK